MRYGILGLLMVMLAGCVKAPIEGRADPYVAPQVSFADADLANRTAVLPPIMERKDGILYVTVPVRVASDLDLHIDYQVTFFNENGAPIEQTSWIGGTTITRNSYRYIKVNSSSGNAVDFHMQLRYAQ
ncbi:MAG TPA: hypothetical protein VHP11_15545 [Tepidisphaeraceae bacterium]|nr:hypothetical protein [Tepidisphaeraceae bacterium]